MTERSPLPADVRAARESAGLSQTQAAKLVRSALRTWQQWESGARAMHPGLWELLCIKLGTPENAMITTREEAIAAVENAAWDEDGSGLEGSDIWGAHGPFAAPHATSFFSYESALLTVLQHFDGIAWPARDRYRQVLADAGLIESD